MSEQFYKLLNTVSVNEKNALHHNDSCKLKILSTTPLLKALQLPAWKDVNATVKHYMQMIHSILVILMY